MFSVFDKSGIFIASKYLLAIIDKLLTIYRKNSGCTYDIGCAFSKTLTNSSLDFHLMHPMYIPGTGHTEGKGCKHIFSSSNELACSMRHTIKFPCCYYGPDI
ncbi:hypothetical protein BD769DRAFT_1628512 [Suillus cothurnatus]|nr:hypothetical protein BD769DRAFT_1628512 [Suillus cothurnatus]